MMFYEPMHPAVVVVTLIIIGILIAFGIKFVNKYKEKN